MQSREISSVLCSFVFAAQPAGLPEILKKSLHSSSVGGGEEVFIIGKNFLKDTKVIFQENASGEKSAFQTCSDVKFRDGADPIQHNLRIGYFRSMMHICVC